MPGTDSSCLLFSSAASLSCDSLSSRNKSVGSSPANSCEVCVCVCVCTQGFISPANFYSKLTSTTKKITPPPAILGTATGKLELTLICTRKSLRCSLKAGISLFRWKSPSTNTFTCTLWRRNGMAYSTQ